MNKNANDDRHEQQNRPLKDIDATAKAQGTTRAKIQQSSASNRDSSSQPPLGPDQRRDGYYETQGYGQSQNTVDASDAQKNYDPAHSGVRHAQNKPGTRPPTPGRETGTSWGQDQQMGTTTDTPDRKNPAN
jgi:hypothetical protein